MAIFRLSAAATIDCLRQVILAPHVLFDLLSGVFSGRAST